MGDDEQMEQTAELAEECLYTAYLSTLATKDPTEILVYTISRLRKPSERVEYKDKAIKSTGIHVLRSVSARAITLSDLNYERATGARPPKSDSERPVIKAGVVRHDTMRAPPPVPEEFGQLEPNPILDIEHEIEVDLGEVTVEDIPDPPPTRPSCPSARPARYELIDALGVVTILSAVELEIFCLELDDVTRDALMALMPGDGCAGPDWMIRRMVSSEAPLSLNYPPSDRFSIARPEPPQASIYAMHAIPEDRIVKTWRDENGRKRRRVMR